MEVTLATEFQTSLECMSPHLKKLEVNNPNNNSSSVCEAMNTPDPKNLHYVRAVLRIKLFYVVWVLVRSS